MDINTIERDLNKYSRKVLQEFVRIQLQETSINAPVKFGKAMSGYYCKKPY